MEQNRNRGSPQLLFSKEELDNPALSRPAKKAAKAADKYEATQKKLPTRHRLRLTREEIETGQACHAPISGRSFQGNRAKFAHTLARISKGS